MLITFVARTYYIPPASMVPTLQIHDVLLVDKFEYRFHSPNRGDIVVFPPPIPTPDDFIKRVIGRPGDTPGRALPAPSIVNGTAAERTVHARKTRSTTRSARLRHLRRATAATGRSSIRRRRTFRRNRSGRRPIEFRRTATS